MEQRICQLPVHVATCSFRQPPRSAVYITLGVVLSESYCTCKPKTKTRTLRSARFGKGSVCFAGPPRYPNLKTTRSRHTRFWRQPFFLKHCTHELVGAGCPSRFAGGLLTTRSGWQEAMHTALATVPHTCRAESNAMNTQPSVTACAASGPLFGKVSGTPPHPTPNPSIERTRSGSTGLAFISFWAKPAPPPRAAHVKR